MGAEAKDTVAKKFYLKNAYCWTTTPGTTRVRHMCLQYCDGRTWKDREGVGCGPRTNIRMDCTSKPRNTHYIGSGYVYSSWNEEAGMWLPSPTSSYSAVAIPGECNFTCNEGYERDGGACTLYELPDILLEVQITAASQTVRMNNYYANSYTVNW
jgi:hypothetical protein